MRKRPSYKHVARYAISRWMGWMVIEVQLNVQWTISTLSHFFQFFNILFKQNWKGLGKKQFSFSGVLSKKNTLHDFNIIQIGEGVPLPKSILSASDLFFISAPKFNFLWFCLDHQLVPLALQCQHFGNIGPPTPPLRGMDFTSFDIFTATLLHQESSWSPGSSLDRCFDLIEFIQSDCCDNSEAEWKKQMS